MNLVSLCLKIPNLGILVFYLIFIVIIPYLLILNKNLSVLKYYLPMLIAFANLLSHVGDEKIFKNLYSLKPDNFVCFLSSNFINLFALFGILWQCLEYSKSRDGNVTKAVIYGAMLFIIAFPFARNGLVFVLENVDYYLRKKTELTYEYNWHLLVFGLLYIIFLLGFQAIILALVDSSSGEQKRRPMKTFIPKIPKPSIFKPKKQMKNVDTMNNDLQEINSQMNTEVNLQTNKKNKLANKDTAMSNNNINQLLKNSTLSNLNNISKYVNQSNNNGSGKQKNSNNYQSSSKKSSSSSKRKKISKRIVPIN